MGEAITFAERLWPFVQALAMCFIAVAGFAIRSQIARLTKVENILDDIKDVLRDLNISITGLKSAYEGHERLDDARFNAIDHRLDAHRATLESLRGSKGHVE